MAWDPVGKEFADPFGGQADLQARIVRCVGSAIERAAGFDAMPGVRAGA